MIIIILRGMKWAKPTSSLYGSRLTVCSALPIPIQYFWINFYFAECVRACALLRAFLLTLEHIEKKKEKYRYYVYEKNF